MNVKKIISTLERHQRECQEILAALHQIDRHSAVKVDGKMSFEDFERRVIRDALRQVGGNQTHAARILDMTRDRLRYKISKHGLEPKRRPANRG